MTVHFAPSPFSPIAMSFFGLGTGYIILGGQALFNYPPSTADVRRALGVWAVCVPGVVQTVASIVMLVGLTWFGVFEAKPDRYFLAVAFLGFAAHWLAMGFVRYTGVSELVEGWMGLPFFCIAFLGIWIFLAAGDIGVAIAFMLLSLVYLADSAFGFQLVRGAKRLQGLCQFTTGWWLIYLVWAITLDYTGTVHWWH